MRNSRWQKNATTAWWGTDSSLSYSYSQFAASNMSWCLRSSCPSENQGEGCSACRAGLQLRGACLLGTSWSWKCMDWGSASLVLAVGLVYAEVQPSVLILKLTFVTCGQNQKVIFSAMENPLVSKLKIENTFFWSIFTFISTNVDEGKQLKIYQMKSTWLVESEAFLLVNDCCEESYSFPLNFQR